MRKRLIPIYSVLAIAILLLAVLVPGCGGTTGTIVVKATLDGLTWTGNVSYTLTPASGSPTSGTYVEQTFTDVAAGNWTCAYVSGGPGAFLNITPSATQSVAAGGTTTFVLNFVSVQVDAYVTFKTWTHNGTPIPVLPPGGILWINKGDWIDAEYEEHVSGAQAGAPVPVHQTSWLQVHNIGEEGNPEANSIWLHCVNAPGAVKMNPPASKLSQQCTVEGDPVQPCHMVELKFCQPVNLDVEIDWELAICTNYTKTINWIGYPSPADILFDAVNVTAFHRVTLVSWACVEVGEGFVDTNTANDCSGNSTMLTIGFMP
jgi:hypothetical protein